MEGGDKRVEEGKRWELGFFFSFLLFPSFYFLFFFFFIGLGQGCQAKPNLNPAGGFTFLFFFAG